MAAREAAEKAARADLIVFSAAPDGPFPVLVKAWIEAWLSHRGDREGMLVGLLEAAGSPGGRGRAKTSLISATAAHRGAMDYLTQVPQDLSRAIPDSLDSYTRRADQVTSLLDDILHQQATAAAACCLEQVRIPGALFGSVLPCGGVFLLLADHRGDGLQFVALVQVDQLHALVLRPASRMSFTKVRTIWPPAVISMISSASRTVSAPTTAAGLLGGLHGDDALCRRATACDIPLSACTRYSSNGVRLPMPFSPATSSVASGTTTASATTDRPSPG